MSFYAETISEEKWKATLSKLINYDFSHTLDFHRISEAYGEGNPLAFVAHDENGEPAAMWPVLKRRIKKTDLFDFTSAYGYAGPVFATDSTNSRRAVEAIFDAMGESGAVSLFSRMHPLVSNQIDKSVRGTQLGKVIIIDVGTDPNTLKDYRENHKRDIVKARANGMTISVETGASAVADFHAIYQQAMSDLGAREYYFFNSDYLNALASATDFGLLILFASLEGKKIASTMFTLSGSVMQYYLSGTLSEFRNFAPSKLIIAEAHKLAAEMGLNKLILGGGLGSSQDALFRFKQGFSKTSLPFHVTRRILNHEHYSALCEARGIDPDTTSFFPAYRAEPSEAA